MKLLAFLLAFLRLGVEPETPDPDPSPAPDPAPDPSDDLTVDPAEPDPKPDDKSPEAEAALAAIKAEKERGDRFERELNDLRGRSPQPRSPSDLTEDEERILKNEKATALEKWQVQANVELRRGRSEAQFALAQAHDIADRTAFSRLANTNAVLFKRYESRVEEELTKMRQKGYNASREQIMHNLIGKDMTDGKFTKKAAPKKDDDTKPAVPRGRLPGARSDVSGKSGMSEHEKRRQRLENQQI